MSETRNYQLLSWTIIVVQVFQLDTHIYIYIYTCILFDPVKPELGIIPSGQKLIEPWTFKFSWQRAQCNWQHRAIISLRKTKTRLIRIINIYIYIYIYINKLYKFISIHIYIFGYQKYFSFNEWVCCYQFSFFVIFCFEEFDTFKNFSLGKKFSYNDLRLKLVENY